MIVQGRGVSLRPRWRGRDFQCPLDALTFAVYVRKGLRDLVAGLSMAQRFPGLEEAEAGKARESSGPP